MPTKQRQQIRRLLRDDIDVAAELQARVLDPGDQRQCRCGGAADDAVGAAFAAHELRGALPDMLDRLIDRGRAERDLDGVDLAQRIGKAGDRVLMVGERGGRRAARRGVW